MKENKQQRIILTIEQNKRLHNIKKYLRLDNINQVFVYLIDNFDSGFEEYLNSKNNIELSE